MVNEYFYLSSLLNYHLGDYKASLTYANRIIHDQTSRTEIDRNGSALSFAYFWSGRGNLKLGNITLASAMWKRAASEYYSTFYGALGHFMLEHLSHKPLRLEPTRTGKFHIQKLQKPVPGYLRKKTI